MKDIIPTSKIFAKPNPFTDEVLECDVPIGMSIREVIGHDHDGYFVFVNGIDLASEEWDTTLVQAEDVINIIKCPGGSGNDALRIVAVIAVIVLAYWAGPAISGALTSGMTPGAATFAASTSMLYSATFWTSATMFAGLMAVNMLLPYEMPDLGGAGESRRLYAVTGSRNQFNPYGHIPILYGRHKLFPPFAAYPFTEIVGEDAFFNAVYCIGLGDYEVDPSSIKIGDTLATDYQGVDITVTDQPTLPDAFEENLGLTLNQSGVPPAEGDSYTRTTQPDTTKIGVDIQFPAGLLKVTKGGDRETVIVRFRVEYSPAGQNQWQNVTTTDWEETAGSNLVVNIPGRLVEYGVDEGPLVNAAFPSIFEISGRSNDFLRVSLNWSVPEGQYDVRVTRVATVNNGNFQWADGPGYDRYSAVMQWGVLRSFSDQPAVVIGPGIATFLQVRIRANDQLTGIVDSISLVATRRLRSWNVAGQSWNAPAATRSPAWAFVDILTGYGNARPITDESTKLWLDDLADWATSAANTSFYYDEVIDFKTSVFEALRRCCFAGRASLSQRDGRWTVVQEPITPTPVQWFTPRNSWGFSSTKRLIEYPHGLKVRFPSEQDDYQDTEVIVYDDGQDENNSTRFDVLELRGITDYDQAWRFGRYAIAAAKHRPELYSFSADIEHIVAQRGDVISVSHDIPLWGSGYGRITSISGNTITIDNALDLDGTYVVRVRLSNGTSVVQSVGAITAVDVDTFTFTPSAPAGIAVGDLVMVGESGSEVANLVVLSVEPSNDLTARLTCVDYSAAILIADIVAIPPYNPRITRPVNYERVLPPVPGQLSAYSGSMMVDFLPSGDSYPRMVVSWVIPPGRAPVSGTQVFVSYRRVDALNNHLGPWVNLPGVQASIGWVAVSSAENGATYQIRARSVSATGLSSPYTATIVHSVQGRVVSTVAPPVPVTVEDYGFIRLQTTFPVDWAGIVDVTRLEYGWSLPAAPGTILGIARVPCPRDPSGETIEHVWNFSDQTERLFVARLVDIEGNMTSWSASVSATPFAISSRSIRLLANSQIFSYDNADGTPALIGPTSIEFTASRSNLTGAVLWTLRDSTGAELTPVTDYLALSGADNSVATLTAVEFGTIANNSFITVRASSEDLYDEISVTRLQSGQDGAAGDAITGLLTNEAHVEPTFSDGTGASLGDAGGTFRVWEGVTEVTTSAAFSIVGAGVVDGGTVFQLTTDGLRITINKTTGVYTLDIPTAWTQLSTTFTLRAVYGGVTIDKTYSIVKAPAGEDAEDLVYLQAYKATDDYVTAPGDYPLADGATYSVGGVFTPINGWYTTIAAARANGSGDAIWVTQFVVRTFASSVTVNNGDWDVAVITAAPPAPPEPLPAAEWLTGSGAPAGVLGAIGDFYLNADNGDYYEKTGAAAWTLRGNIRGPAGVGTTGPTGWSVVELKAYRRSASPLSTPTGGEYDFDNYDFTPPANWHIDPPNTGTDPVYVVFGTAAIQKGTPPNVDSAITWTAPVLAAGKYTPITPADLASGISAIEIVASLPSAGNYEGRVVYLTTDNKLYRHAGTPTDDTGFSRAVDGADLVVGSVTAAKVNVAQLSSIAALIGYLQNRANGISATGIPYMALTASLSPIEIYDANGKPDPNANPVIVGGRRLFGIDTVTVNGQQEARVGIRGSFAANTISDAAWLTDAGADALRARLGYTTPLNPSGGSIATQDVNLSGSTTTQNVSLNPDTIPSAGTGAYVSASLKLYGVYAQNLSSDPGWVAPQYTIQFQFDDNSSFSSPTNFGSAQTLNGYANWFPGEPAESIPGAASVGISATATVDGALPASSAVPLYWRAVITKVTGYSLSNLEVDSFSVTEEVVGDVAAHTHGTFDRAATDLSGAAVFDRITVADGIVTDVATRNLTAADIGAAASSHTPSIANVTGLQTALDGKAASSHTHSIANVTGLQTALDGKAASSHTHSPEEASAARAYVWSPVITVGAWSRIARTEVSNLGGQYLLSLNHTRSSVVVSATFFVGSNHSNSRILYQLGSGNYTQIQVRLTDVDANNCYIEILDTAAPGSGTATYSARLIPLGTSNATTYSSYTAGAGTVRASLTTVFGAYRGPLVWDDLTSVPDYSLNGHTHSIANVSGLQTALDGKAASSHTHSIANVTGLQTALDGKASSSHTHSIANVTGLQTALDAKLAISAASPTNENSWGFRRISAGDTSSPPTGWASGDIYFEW